MTKENTKKEQNYTVKQQVLIPYELTFKVLAESPEEALKKINSVTTHKKKILPGTKKINAKVYDYGKLNLLLTKRY